MSSNPDGLISKQTLGVIEACVADICSHAVIDNLMQQYGFDQHPHASVTNKLSKVHAYFNWADWSKQATVTALLQLLGHILTDLTSRNILEYHTSGKRLVATLGKREGFFWNGVDFDYPTTAALDHAQEIVHRFDLTHVDQELRRILANIAGDPDDAITSAKCLLESTCRAVLSDFPIEPSRTADLLELVKLTFDRLGLLPDQVSDKAKGADAIKKTLRSMTAAVQGLAEIRNLYGDSHGKAKDHKGLEPRHARLAATLAGGLATFILETHEQRKAR